MGVNAVGSAPCDEARSWASFGGFRCVWQGLFRAGLNVLWFGAFRLSEKRVESRKVSICLVGGVCSGSEGLMVGRLPIQREGRQVSEGFDVFGGRQYLQRVVRGIYVSGVSMCVVSIIKSGGGAWYRTCCCCCCSFSWFT